MKKLLVSIAVALGLLAASVSPASAASGCASWGCAWSVDYISGRWHGTVDDTLTDGYCVSLWTITSAGTKVNRIARSCGAPVGGSVYGGGSEDTYGVRMFRDNGNYKTIVWP